VEFSPWPHKVIDEDELDPMNMKRMRGRNHRPNGGGGGNNGGGGFRNQQNGIPLNRNHVFDSSGPEMRVRGTAQQLYEKYQQLARDASSNGDRVTGEAYYQHAEHYFRIISAINQAQGQPNQPVQGQPHAQNGQQAPYQNNGPDRNGNQAETQNGQQNGYYNNQNRRYEQNGNDRQNLQPDETPLQAEPQNRAVEPRQYEPRQQEPRQEPRQQEPRQQEPRRFEQRKPEFQRNDRNNDRQERFRPETPMVDTRIDISSALEAELAAAVAEPQLFNEPAPQPVLEARAIPIIPDAPPQSDPAPEPEVPPARVAKPRGRPRAVKAEPKE
jgi:hypothetical protein